MKPERLLRIYIGLLCVASRAVARGQGIVSQLGGFLEQSRSLPALEADTSVSPLSLFLQQDQPAFPVASPPLAPPPLASQWLPVASSQQSLAFAPLSQANLAAALAPPELAAPGVTPPVHVTPFGRPKGLLSLRSLRVMSSGPEGSKIFFGSGSEFAMGTDSAGNFIVQQSSAASPLMSLDSQNTLHLGAARVEARALDAVNGLSVRGVRQWQLVYSDDFSSFGTGWSRLETSMCGGVVMLGGYCKFGSGEVNKTFSGLPPHKQLRVVAKYHFIDRWIGETGYMKLDVGANDCPVAVWSEQYRQDGGKGIDLCGNADIPEGKFSAPVDVTVQHHQDSVSVTFGATIGSTDPCDESWGVSAVEVYVRN